MQRFLLYEVMAFFESVFVNSQQNFSELVLMKLNVEIGIVDRWIYRGVDKSLARPGRKHATATEDFEFHIPYL